MSIRVTPLEDHRFYLEITPEEPSHKGLLFDPFFSATQVEALKVQHPVHYILLTHLPNDVKNLASVLAAFSQATLVAQDGIISQLKSKIPQVNTITMSPGQELDFPWTGAVKATSEPDGIGRLVMTESPYRFSNSEIAYPEINGFIINAEGHQIYHTGYHPFLSDLRDIGAAYKPDVALFPVSQSLGYGPEEIYRAIMWIGCDIVLPYDATTQMTCSQRVLIGSEGNNIQDAITGVEGKQDFDFQEIASSIDIYTPAICRSLVPGQTYTLEPTFSSGRSAGPESRY